MSDTFKKENFPTDGGESFLADWQGAGAGQVERGQKKIVIASGEDVGFEVPVQQQQQDAGATSTQMGGGDGYNWVPNDDLSP